MPKNKKEEDKKMSKKAPVKALPVKKEVKKPEPMITFKQYFKLLGNPAHHAPGMLAYKKTSGKRSKDSWDKLFANY